MLKIHTTSQEMEAGLGPETLDALARRGAQAMLHQALEEEVAAYLAQHQERDAQGHAPVVRNGKARARSVTCGGGDADELIDRFASVYGPKHPKAVACLVDDREALLTFFDFPAAHWQHIRTSNPVESPFATVRLRQRVTKGAGTRTKGLTMAFKLLAMAEQRWRRLNGAHRLPLVRAGVRFVDGEQLERQEEKKHRKDAA